MISRLTRVSWTVGTETASIFKRRSPSISSFPVAPPVKPIHLGFSPNPWRAMATCAALPPGARWASETRLTPPTWNSLNTSRVSMAGFKLTQKKAALCPRESASGLFIGGILFQPGRGMAKALIDGLDVGDAFGFQPFLKRLRPAPDKNAHAVLPSGASAKHAAEMHACFGGKLEGFVERAIAHTCGEKQKGFRSRFGGPAKKSESVFAAVDKRSRRGRRALNVGHGYRDSNFQNVHAIARLRKFLHGAR